MKRFQGLLWGYALLILFSCKEEQRTPLVSGEIPGKVVDYKIENFAGGSEITYAIPDAHVAYIEADYEIKEGLWRTAKSSKYKNSITVDGFPYAGEYKVSLTAVGRDEQRSEPVVVTINPLKPPVLETFETLEMTADFGGIRVLGQNMFESDLVIEVITPDETGEWKIAEQYYTSSENIKFSARGFDPEKRKFGVYVRDRWLNYSDTLISEINPFFEAPVDMTGFKETNLPGDQVEQHLSYCSISAMFDGLRGNYTQGYYSKLNSGVPQHFTINLMGLYQLSRLKFWQNLGVTYGSANPRKFKIWGSTNPNPDGSFDESWILLGEFENIKPSGQPVGTNSPEDTAQATAGDEFTFELDIPPVQYIRFETMETWGKSQQVYISELAFWGSKIN